MRMTRAQLRAHLQNINKIYYLKLELEYANEGLRVFDTQRGRNLSPRLPVTQMRWWLDGFSTGLDRK